MIQRIGQPIFFAAQFTAGGLPADPSTGTVLVSVNRIDLADGNIDEQVTDAVADSLANGMASYRHASTGFPGIYVARMRTTAAEIDQKTILAPQAWQVGSDLFELLWTQLPKLGGNAVALPSGAIAAGQSVAAVNSSRFEQMFSVLGLSISGWAKAIFTIKRSLDDSDADALLLLRASNPAAPATDGLLVFKGKPVDVADPMRATGLLTVLAETPDTSLSIILTAAAMQLPPAPVNAPFVYEISWYMASGDKVFYQSGELTIQQSARRSIAAP